MVRRVVLAVVAALLPACGDESTGGTPTGTSSGTPAGTSTGRPTGSPLGDHERETTLGVVAGVQEGDAWVFRGIPFAAPPVGALRFAPPAPHPGWDGPLDASAYGAPCTQLDGGDVIGSEDCLTLNVWEPVAPSDSLRPVMVWIHGGDNMGGSTSDPGFLGGEIYDGHALATRGDVVFLSVQYRVGAFGFLSHPEFAADNARASTGNWGLMDQIAALEWVRDNVASFGGDPDNVMVFGQSAGGDDTCALIASPRAAGLFHRAAPMSPGGCHVNDSAVSANVTAVTTAVLGCTSDTIACLRDAPASAVAMAPQSGSPLHPDRIDFYVEIDGWVLTEPPRDTFLAGTHNHVPILWGTTAEEYALILSGALPPTLDAASYAQWMDALFGPTIGPQALAAYDPADYGGSFHVGLIAAFGDAVHHCSTRAAVRALAQTQAEPVHRYVYAHAYDHPSLAPYAAAHGFDIPLIFANHEGMMLTADELALSDALLAAFTAFAHDGDPNATAQAPFPAYDGSDSYAIPAVPWTTLTGFRAAQCDFWDGVWGL